MRGILGIKLGRSSDLQDKYFRESYPQPASSVLNALKFSVMHSHNDGDDDSDPYVLGSHVSQEVVFLSGRTFT